MNQMEITGQLYVAAALLPDEEYFKTFG